MALPPKFTCCTSVGAPGLGQDDAEELAGLLKALADPIRLRLMNLIAQAGEACACDLPAALDRSQPTVSHHLKVLVEAGLLERDKRGKWAWFRIQPQQLQAVSAALHVESEPAV